MAADTDKGAGREFRLEGVVLAAVVAVLVAGFAVAFFSGRWYERRYGAGAAGGMAAGAVDPLANVEEPGVPADAAEGMDYFDTLQGEGKAAEPGREARPRAPGEAAAPAAEVPKSDEPAPAATHFVQVFAGRTRSSAEELVDKLQQQGYTARLQSDDRGGERLYKVQVGYGGEDEARSAVEELRSKGFPSAFYVNAG